MRPQYNQRSATRLCLLFYFSTAAPGHAVVKREKLKDVVGDHGFSVHNYLDDEYKPRPVSEIKEEALKHVGEERPYDLLRQNCEHFVTNVRYGKPESRQVQVFECIMLSF